MKSALCLVLLVGCGRIGFDDTVLGDGGTDGPGLDAPPACATFGPWSTPRRQVALSTADEDWEPVIHPAGLAIVYSFKAGATSGDLLFATRPSTTADFGTPMRIFDTDVEFGPAWSKDGTQLYFTRYDGATLATLVATYGGGTFGPASIAITPPGSFSIETTSSGLELFYTKEKGTFDYDIHHATRTSTTMPWTEDGLLSALVRNGMAEGWPSLDEVNQTLYLESDGPTQADLAMTTRTAPGAPFGPLTTITELGEGGDPDIAAGGLTIAFASRRPGGAGSNDIYISTRTCQ